MPHACSTPRQSPQALSSSTTISAMSAAAEPADPSLMTHICESPDSTTTFCGLPVEQVGGKVFDCHPQPEFGVPHGRCMQKCREPHH